MCTEHSHVCVRETVKGFVINQEQAHDLLISCIHTTCLYLVFGQQLWVTNSRLKEKIADTRMMKSD
jgi:hypothetical protein